MGVRAALENEKDLNLIAECASPSRAVQLANELQPDIVLMDIDFPQSPELNGTRAARLINTDSPSIKIIMLTNSTKDSDIFESLKAGASGYLDKTVGLDPLLDGIRAVFNNATLVVSPGVASFIAAYFDHTASVSAKINSFPALTATEYQVLTLLAQGKTNKEIANDTHLTYQTVRNYIVNIKHKLQVSDRIQLALMSTNPGIFTNKRNI